MEQPSDYPMPSREELAAMSRGERINAVNRAKDAEIKRLRAHVSQLEADVKAQSQVAQAVTELCDEQEVAGQGSVSIPIVRAVLRRATGNDYGRPVPVGRDELLRFVAAFDGERQGSGYLISWASMIIAKRDAADPIDDDAAHA